MFFQLGAYIWGCHLNIICSVAFCIVLFQDFQVVFCNILVPIICSVFVSFVFQLLLRYKSLMVGKHMVVGPCAFYAPIFGTVVCVFLWLLLWNSRWVGGLLCSFI